MMPKQGTASVKNGLMHINSQASYAVFLHELMHFNGFEDEYALPVKKQAWLCQLEGVVAGTVKSQLLKRNTQAHAVDDIRISRGQFQQILRQWQSLGFVTVSGEGVRALWKALADVAKA